MNTTTALLLPLSTRALASIHILAATTAAFAGGGVSHNSFGYAAGGGVDSNICYPTALSSSHISGSNSLPQQQQPPHYQSPYQHQYQHAYHHQYYQHDYSHSGSSNNNTGPAEWLFSINVLYLLLAPLLLRELPAMMATLDPLIDYLFDGPSSWLAFPGWCAELWSLLREEKRNIVSRRKSYDELDALRVGKNVGLGPRPGDGPPRRKTW
ncbi:hypothetical protein IWZ01DRAFT_542423 [Phyllosticta capitalensis]